MRVIAEEEHVVLPQLRPLAAECDFHLAKNLAMVYRIHCNARGNVMIQDYSLHVPKHDSHTS